jgi:uncharacterized damage-inducible protein DinB
MPATIPETFRRYSIHIMERSEKTIDSCLARLTDEQVLHRNGDYENSIANLLLHVSGNIRQWIMHGIAGHPDVRTRDAEFDLHPSLPVAEIRERFRTTLAEARDVITSVPDDRLLVQINPQPGAGWDEPAILEAIYRVVSHIELHTGQITLLTKQLTRSDLDLTLPRKR